MLVLKYLLEILGAGLIAGAAGVVIYDIYVAAQFRRLLGRTAPPGQTAATAFSSPDSDTAAASNAAVAALRASQFPPQPIRWGLARQLAISGVVPLLLAASIIVIPDGHAAVRISQIWGARPGTLYPGVHIVTPLIDSVALYDTREQVYTTSAAEPKSADASPASNEGPRRPVSTAPSTNALRNQNAQAQTGEVLIVQAREGLNIGLAVSVRYRLDPQRLSYIHANLPQPVGDEVVAPTVATIYR
jgi:hypothetical protein